MGFDKLKIITGTLEAQVVKFEKNAKVMRKDMHEHQGALEAFQLLGGQMSSFAAGIEKRIEEDLDLGGAADRVRVYAKNIIARFHAMCESNERNQLQQRFIAEGRLDAAEQTIKDLQKDIEMHRVAAARREELAEEGRRNYQDAGDKSEEDKVKAGFERAEEAASVQEEVANEVDELVGAASEKPPKKPRRKRRTKAQIAADKKAAAAKKAAKKA